MKIKVAIVGVGNCAKSLLEGISYYSRLKDNCNGLMHRRIGPYDVTDISFVAAFDVDRRKVGLQLDEAIKAVPNRTDCLSEVFPCNTIVQRGPSHDSIIPKLRSYFIHESDDKPIDVAAELKRARVEIVVSYLPTGSDQASYAYAEAALAADCSYINCMPSLLARDPAWRSRFQERGLVLLGDDIKSQLGATILNRALLRLFAIRGVKVISSDQVNYGGNADHFNLHYRAHSKETSKEASLLGVLGPHLGRPTARMVYTEENYDHKHAEIVLKGEIFAGAPVTVKIRLDDEDSPNSAGVVVDAIRSAKLLVDAGMSDRASDIAPLLMKAPPRQYSDEEARNIFTATVQAASKTVSMRTLTEATSYQTEGLGLTNRAKSASRNSVCGTIGDQDADTSG